MINITIQLILNISRSIEQFAYLRNIGGKHFGIKPKLTNTNFKNNKKKRLFL